MQSVKMMVYIFKRSENNKKAVQQSLQNATSCTAFVKL